MALYQIGKGTYELPDNLDPEQLKNYAQQVYDKYEATRQSDFGYGIDRMQQGIGYGIDAIGRMTGSETVEQFGRDQINRNQQQIEEGRWSPDYAGNFSDQTGIKNKFGYALEQLTTQGPRTGTALVGGAATVVAGIYSVPAAAIVGGGTLALNWVQSTGEAAEETEEKTGDYNEWIAAGTGTLVALLDRFGAGKVIPKDQLMNMTGDQLVKELTEKGFGEAATEVAKKIGQSAKSEIGTELLQEAAIVGQSAAQGGEYTTGELADRAIDTAVLAGTQGGLIRGAGEGVRIVAGDSQQTKFDKMETALQPILGRERDPTNLDSEAEYRRAQTIMDAITKARNGDSKAANEALKFIDQSAADASLANRLQTISQSGPVEGKQTSYDLKDVETQSKTGSKAVVEQAHKDIVGEIKAREKVLSKQLKGTKEEPRFQVLMERILAETGISLSKNKTKNYLTKQNFEAVAELVGNTQEGQELLNLMREANSLSNLYGEGLVGGISKYTDQFNPLGINTGYDSGRAVANTARIIGSVAAGASTMGASTAVQAATVGAGRVLGRGSRSNVENFIKNNIDGRPLESQKPPEVRSIVDDQEKANADARLAAEVKQREAEENARQKAEEAATEKAAIEAENRQSVKDNDPPVPTSPQGTLEAATGLDRTMVARALRMLEGKGASKRLRQAIQEYKTSVDIGGKIKGKMLNNLIRKVNGLANQYPNVITRIAQPDTGAFPNYVQEQERVSYKESEAYARGVEANNNFAKALTDELDADQSIEPVVKAQIGRVLLDFSMPLNPDPVTRINQIMASVSENISPALIDKYITPYAERVMRQQGQKPIDREDSRVVPVPFGNERMQGIFGVNDPTEGGNYINLDDNNADVTGTSYTGGTVSIVDGKPVLETNDIPSNPATKDLGWKTKVNLFKKKAGWSWVDTPRTEETIVSTESRGKHHYSLATDFQTPVTLETYPKQKSEPRMRPSTYGDVILGNKVGTISVRGKPHPVYDTVTVVPKDQGGSVEFSKTVDMVVPEIQGTGKKGSITIEDIARHFQNESDKNNRTAARTETKGKPTNKVDYTPELEERVYQDILKEVSDFFKAKPESAYWYTFGSPEAMRMLEKAIPEFSDSNSHPDAGAPLKMLFWALISPLSGGQDPVANAKNAIDVINYYIKNGTIPSFKYDQEGTSFFLDPEKVRERDQQIANNELSDKGQPYDPLAWTARGKSTQMPLEALQNGIDKFGSLAEFMIWLTEPHPVQQVRDVYENLGFGTLKRKADGKSYLKITNQMADEYTDNGLMYGAQVLGPKFGPFMLNNTGNESKVTKDEWFTRGWNRLVGRMFDAKGKNLMAQPADATERAVQDRVIGRVANELGLEPAQVQATWWAFEQNLYTQMGVKSPTRDYIDGAKEAIKVVAGEIEADDAEQQGRARLSEFAASQADGGQTQPILADASLKPTDLGVLPSVDPNKPIQSVSLEPTKASMQEARSVITEISSKKPIRDMETLTLLARAFNTDIVYAGDQQTMNQIFNDYGMAEQNYSKFRYNDNSNAFFVPLTTLDPIYDDDGTVRYKRVHGKAGLCVVKTGKGYNPEGMVRSAFHEVAHAMTLLNPDDGTNKIPLSYYNEKNPINKRQKGEHYFSTAFIDSFYKTISSSNKKLVKKIIDEVKSVQDRSDFNTDVFPEVQMDYREGSSEFGTVVSEIQRREKRIDEIAAKLQELSKQEDRYLQKGDRGFMERDRAGDFGPSEFDFLYNKENALWAETRRMQSGEIPESIVTREDKLKTVSLERLKRAEKSHKEHIRGYLWNLREIIVDATMMAISNPKQAQEEIPEFYKLLQQYFNGSDGPQFLAFMLPVLMMLNMEDEERDILMQGALSPQGQGMLMA